MLAGTVVAYALVRWPGALPLGSDNDEYQLAAQALLAGELPLIAGVEGTKYPLGYPALLAALSWVGLPMAPAALTLNLLALTATVGLTAWLAGRPTAELPGSPGAALASGMLVATSAPVWNDVFSVMPELLLLLLIAAMLVTLERPLGVTRTWLLVGLAVAAVLLKTLAALLVVGGCGLLWLSARRSPTLTTDPGDPDGSPGRPWRALLPAAAAVVTVLTGMLIARGLPEHTTGYLATFPLRDPFDASAGRLGPAGLLRRAMADTPDTLADLGRAIALIDASVGEAAVIAVVGLSAGVLAAFMLRRGAPLGPFAAGAVLAYAVGMAAWPYFSSRFGLPLVPIAALAAGGLVRLATHRVRVRHLDLVVGAAVAVALVVTSGSAVADRGAAGQERLAEQHAAMEKLERFADAGGITAEDRIISFDYREVARRLDRDVQPLPYTDDTAALLELVEDADVVVRVSFHHARDRQLNSMLESAPERFETVLERPGLSVHRVVG